MAFSKSLSLIFGTEIEVAPLIRYRNQAKFHLNAPADAAIFLFFAFLNKEK